jgi:hypothetical protein
MITKTDVMASKANIMTSKQNVISTEATDSLTVRRSVENPRICPVLSPFRPSRVHLPLLLNLSIS